METTERHWVAQLLQTALGYWRSQVLFTAINFDLFRLLDGRPLSSEEIAQRCGTAPIHTAALLNACVSLGLLEKADGGFRNTALSAALLVSGRPGHMGDWVRFMADCYRPWGCLAETVRTGAPAEDGLKSLLAGSGTMRHLILGMDDYARGPGRAMAEGLDLGRALDGRRLLLDVGGGPGTYSALLAEKLPQLRAVVFDLPSVIEITRDLLVQAGRPDLGGRVGVQGGDYLVDDLGAGYDAVLLSNVLHQEDPDACVRLLRKAHGALVGGGLLVVHSTMLSPDKDGPPWATLMSLQLMLLYRGGRVYSSEEMLQMVAAAGFVNARLTKPSLLQPESMILATRASVCGEATA